MESIVADAFVEHEFLTCRHHDWGFVNENHAVSIVGIRRFQVFLHIVEHQFCLSQIFCRLGDVVPGCRVQRFEQRNHVVTDLVAQGIIFQIRGIGYVILFLLCQIVEHILSADAEQRSQDVAVLGSDGSESVHARTSEQVEQQGLHIVVTMVSHADAIGFDVFGELGEIAISQVACCHLDAHLVLFGIGKCIEVDAVQGNAFTFAQIHAELFVAITFFATEMEVTMGGLNRHADAFQDEQQGYAVCSSRKGNDIKAIVLPHVVAHDVITHDIFYLIHVHLSL